MLSIAMMEAIKTFYLNLVTIYTFNKISNNNIHKIDIKKIHLIILINIGVSLCAYFIYNIGYYNMSLIVVFITSGIIINLFMENIKSNVILIKLIVSLVIGYAIYGDAVIVSAIPAFLLNLNFTDLSCMIIVGILACILLYFTFKIKRLKMGLNFFVENKISKDIRIFFIIILIFFVVMYIVYKKDLVLQVRTEFFLILVTIITFLYYAISRFITRCYKDRMKDRTIEVQKLEIENNSRKILELQEENMRMAKAVHKYNHKICAIELNLREELAKYDTEFSKELVGVLNETENMAKQFAKETKVVTTLSKTGILGIDNILKYEQAEAIKVGISFDLKIVNNISEIITDMLSQDKIETLLADHVKDAIIAINNSEAKVKNILVVLGKVDGVFEISFYDTGIEFTIPTLLKIGTTPITTYKDSGGSGIGFMTTFDTLNSCMGSLCIEEYRPGTSNFTKSVTISLDGRGEYRIYSYRANEIKKAYSVDNVQKIRIRNI